MHTVYGKIMNTSLKEKRTKGLVVQIPPSAPFISMHPDNIRGRGRHLQRGKLVYGWGSLSMEGVTKEGETRLQKRGLIYVQRARLIYG